MHSSLTVVLIVFQALGAHAAFQYTDCSKYGSDSKFLDIQVWANNVDPD